MPEIRALNERMIEIATKGDALWFEQRPDSRIRMRDAVAKEFNRDLGPAPVGMSWRAIIVEAQPGVRMRQPVALSMTVANDSMDDHQLFELFMQSAPPETRRMLDHLRSAKIAGTPKPAATW